MKKLFGILFLIIFTIKCNANSFDFKTGWKDSKIVEALKNQEIISKILMKDFLKSQNKKVEFDGNVSLVTLKNGLKAVFKSLPLDDLGDAYAEVAAYKASLFFWISLCSANSDTRS
jgi:hypothetical protein